MAKKYYVVWKGHKPGIYSDWAETKQQVDGFPGARYKSFTTEAEAIAALKGEASVGGSPASSKAKPKTKKAADTGVDPSVDITLFCDGGCDPNPGKAGSGIAVYRRDQLKQLWYGMYNPNGTNNTAELNALLQSLTLAEKAIAAGMSVEIRCDSMYSIQCIRDWAPGWEKRGWKKKDGEIKNLELIKQAYALFKELKSSLRLSHVKAHAGTEGNELADRMTMVAVDRKEDGWHKYEPDADGSFDNGSFDIASLLKMRAG